MLRRNTILGLVALSMCACSADRPTLAIVGATVIDGSGAQNPNTTILVRDKVIVSVGPAAEIAVPAGATIVDGIGKFVLPGFADMHVHFASGGMGVKQDYQDLLRQFLYYGVTSILNLGATGGDPATLDQLRANATLADVPIPHIYGAGWLITVPGSHPVTTIMQIPAGADRDSIDWTTRGVRIVESPDEMRIAVRAVVDAGMDVVKIVVESGPTIFGDIHPQMERSLVDAAVDEAAQYDIPVFAHVTSIDELEDVVGAGVHAVVHLVAENEHPSAELLAQMAAKNIRYVQTLGMAIFADVWGEPDQNLTDLFLREGVPANVIASILRSDLLPNSAPSDADWQWRASRLAAATSAREAGIVSVAGTDTGNPVVFGGFSIHHELELLVEAGYSPMEAIVSATRSPAELLGQESVFGTLEIGKRADILVLNADPLEDIRNTRSLAAVILEGEIVDREDFVRSRTIR